MLLGQDLGGGHEGGLVARMHGREHGREGDNRLAAANIALEEAQHWLRSSQVAENVVHGIPLGAGKRERQRVNQGLEPITQRERRGVAALLPLGAAH